ncbi:hypothetical protein [Enterobacter asburiae]|uniref:hypothetical protein n=1 Tax=Enterobacter asburiae TaxID=61645 RepID=UPI003D6FE2F8
MVTLGKADLILVNGQFHTVDRENPVAEAVAVRDGKFLEVGTRARGGGAPPPPPPKGRR